jgi:SAM-dependent methyltransferase
MTAEMIERARRNAARPVNGQLLRNVEFHLATIDQLPLPDATADCILSNCVINLAPDKRAVFRDMFRVLKPGGRVAVSDIALKKPLPAELMQNILAYVGCIAGAISIAEYEAGLRAAGFDAVQVVDTGKDLNAYALVENQSGCCPPPDTGGLPLASSCSSSAAPSDDMHKILADLFRRYNVNDYAASVQVYALKAR